MDISIPYNIERILYYLCNSDSDQVDEIMEAFEAKGQSSVSDTMRESLATRFGIKAVSVGDEDVIKVLRCAQSNKWGVAEDHCSCRFVCVHVRF